jgi:RNA polymerase sigma-70 factor (ECF subfamily)
VLVQERAKLLAYVWAIVRDEHLAEDIFQEVSMLALDKRAEIYDDSSLYPWLRQTARHRALHAVESRKRRPVSLSDGLLDTLDQCWREYDSTPAATLADVLRGCVAQLTAHARQIVTLRYVQGLSGIQVAETLGRNVRTVYMALSRIHGRLRRCVQERMTGGEGRDV